MNKSKKINIILKIGNAIRSKKDYEYFERIFLKEDSFYLDRIKRINYTGLGKVLDAGCGYGQWSFALSKLNKKVYAIDIDTERINIAKKICEYESIKNITFDKGNLEKLQYENNYFDCIFSYSVIYQTNYIKSIKEFGRVLKKNGLLYFSTNGIGWYIYNLIKKPNSSDDFNTRKYALKVFLNSFFNRFRSIKKVNDVYMTKMNTIYILKKYGFKILKIKPEGSIKLNNDINIERIYCPTYMGLTNVFEVLAQKR
ncbi:MAG: class I SAM-dependent methyltransferase [Spirochaetales bacterium]|nr:class I SAM-dependent methyltransferase [Spirochaetales bacterium]